MSKTLHSKIVGTIWVVLLAFGLAPLNAQMPEDFLKKLLKPNPNSPRDLLELLQNPAVAKEVGVEATSIQQVQLKQAALYRESRVVPPTDMSNAEERTAYLAKMKEKADAVNAMINQAIEELLPPEKLERLKQIAYRFETQKMGFAASLTDGWLADVVETHDAQQSTLLRKIGDIEAELQKKIDQLKSEAEVEILAQLSPDQRKKARKALGEPLKFRILSTEEVLLNSTREMIKKQAELIPPK